MTTSSTSKLINELLDDEFYDPFRGFFDLTETGGSYDDEGNFLTWEEWDIRDREEFPEEFLEEDFEDEGEITRFTGAGD